jgi:maltooligosyltrehalose trehalohydrolase
MRALGNLQPHGSLVPAGRVWAPDAHEVVLIVDSVKHPMTRGHDGWWAAVSALRHRATYGYLVDGQGPFPDPRSPFQPDGVHGLSQHVDHRRFAWTDGRWQAPPLGAAVIYELHIGTFSEAGTFAGAITRLPQLVELGVTHVEVMPVAEFSGNRGWGYDGVHLFAPHHAYGSPDDLKTFVNACHAHGLAVLLDVVYNHLGPVGNYLARFGPYFTHRYTTPWGDAVNLDGPGSDEVRRFLCDNAIMWLRDYHFDGLRIDAVHALIDTGGVHFLEQLSCEVNVLEAMLGRHFVLIAESDLNDPKIIRSREAGGCGMHAQWSDDFHHALHAVITGERTGYYEDFGTLASLSRAFRNAFVYAGDWSPHRQRAHGRNPHGLPGWRFVVAAQNHDQVGNRAQGDRLVHLTSVGRAKVAAALVLCAPFVPLLFQGEEWGASTPFQYFTAHDEADIGRAISEGRRKEFAAFGWKPDEIPDPQSIDTFRRSRLKWHERDTPPHAELLAWYRALIAFRRDQPSLRDGDYRSVEFHIIDEDVFVVRRGAIEVACNLSDQPASVPAAARQLSLASTPAIRLADGRVVLPPDAVAVLSAVPATEASVDTGEAALVRAHGAFAVRYEPGTME